jgi:hypothetical protein
MKSGILYVVFNEWICKPGTDEKPYKIGITADSVEERYYGLGLKMPGKFETLFAYRLDNYAEAEQKIHNLFDAYRINGEWFKLTESQLDLIKRNCEVALGGALVTDEVGREVEAETETDADEIESDASAVPLERLIRTVGMKTFVRYYDRFKNNSAQEIIHELQAHENYTLNARRAKASTGKRIFREHLEIQALEIIAKAKLVDEQTREAALALLKTQKV